MRRRVRRIARMFGIAVAGALILLLFSFALPIPAWRTGELPAPPLPLVEGGPMVETPRRIWIDTDAACGQGRRVDPDDCFALLLLARAPSIDVVGVSTSYGNAPLSVTDRTVRDLIAILARDGIAPPPVYRGSTAPGDAAGRAAPEPAHAALREALEDGPLMLVSLGPLTNVAAALKDRPDLQARVGRLVAVMGRRPGHLFHPAEGRGSGGILFGHGPVFRDFNFDQDRAAATAVLDMGLPTTFVPYEAAREVSLTGADLAHMVASGGAAAWIAARARGWLGFWREAVGLPGFYPFDALAAAYVLKLGLFDCATVSAWVGRDENLWNLFYDPPALLVGRMRDRPREAAATAESLYCPRVDPRLHAWLMAQLAPDRRSLRGS